MGPNRSLRIGDDPSADAGSEWVRDVPVRSTAVGPQNAPEAPPFPLGKGKKKINLIKYPKGSDFLKSVVRHAAKWDLVKSVLHTNLFLLNFIGLCLVSEYGLLMF